MNIYLNREGVREGIIKTGKVLLWVAVSGAVTALIAYISDLKVAADSEVLIGVYALTNSLLAGILKWLATKK